VNKEPKAIMSTKIPDKEKQSPAVLPGITEEMNK
jgi:hypothetical protein